MKVELWKLIMTAIGTVATFAFSGFKVYNHFDNRIISLEKEGKAMNEKIVNNKDECDVKHANQEILINEAQKSSSRELKEVSDKINIALVGIARIEGYMKGHFDEKKL